MADITEVQVFIDDDYKYILQDLRNLRDRICSEDDGGEAVWMVLEGTAVTPYHESDGVKGTTMNKWTRYKDENGYWRHVYTLPDQSRVEIQRDPQGTEFAWLVVRYRADGSWRGISPCRGFAKARDWAKFVIECMKRGSLQEVGL